MRSAPLIRTLLKDAFFLITCNTAAQTRYKPPPLVIPPTAICQFGSQLFFLWIHADVISRYLTAKMIRFGINLIKVPLQSNLCFSSCTCGWMLEFHLVAWWHRWAAETFITGMCVGGPSSMMCHITSLEANPLFNMNRCDEETICLSGYTSEDNL